MARDAMRSKPGDLLGVYRRMQSMNDHFGSVMSEHDLFLCPTMAVPAVRADQDIVEGGLVIDGERVDPEFGYSMTHQFNMLCYCSVISVPSGVSDTGVPTGIQIVGRPFDDGTVFRAALAYESARGPWYQTPDTRPSPS